MGSSSLLISALREHQVNTKSLQIIQESVFTPYLQDIFALRLGFTRRRNGSKDQPSTLILFVYSTLYSMYLDCIGIKSISRLEEAHTHIFNCQHKPDNKVFNVDSFSSASTSVAEPVKPELFCGVRISHAGSGSAHSPKSSFISKHLGMQIQVIYATFLRKHSKWDM